MKLQRDPVTVHWFASITLLLAFIGGGVATYYISEYLVPFTTVKGYETLYAPHPEIIVAAIPLFMVLLALEMALIKLFNVCVIGAQYDAADSWSSLTAGTVAELGVNALGITLRLFAVTSPYAYIYTHYGLRVLDDNSWFTMILAFVGSDFSYYWFHRNAHEIGFLWAGHNVHHSSERYNLTTALRQSWLQPMQSFAWYLPFALIISPPVFFVQAQWVTLYQFWIHTCLIRRLPGPIEYIFNTPSHHRVHHDRRVHKNFAGVFITWDRIFGTFQDELATINNSTANTDGDLPEESCVFGTHEAITTWTEAVTHVAGWRPVIFAKKKFIFGPGWSTTVAKRVLPLYSPRHMRLRFVAHLSTVGALYIWTQWTVCLFMLLVVAGKLVPGGAIPSMCCLAYMAASLLSQGLLLDSGAEGGSPRIAIVTELFRLVMATLTVTSTTQRFPSVAPFAVAFHVASFIVLASQYKNLFRSPPKKGL